MTKRQLWIFTLVFKSLLSHGQVDDETKNKMFCAALKNESTAPNYLVVAIDNELTGIRKQVCTEAPFLHGAIDMQNGKQTNKISCKKYKNRIVRLSNPQALSNIGFDLYSVAELDSFMQTIDIPKILDSLKTKKSIYMNMGGKSQVMFAHALFIYGVMTTKGCRSGNEIMLTLFDDK